MRWLKRGNSWSLRGELTWELPNAADSAANVTLVRVLSVPRMPGVQTVPAIAQAINPPAAQPTEAVRSLPVSRLVDAPVESETSDIPPGNRR